MKEINVRFCIGLALLLFGALGSCRPSNSDGQPLSSCDSLLETRKIVSLEIPLYVVDDRFNEILDSVLIVERNCKKYHECTTGFDFRLSASDSSRVVISAVNTLKYDYLAAYGVFEYGGFRFMCSEGHNRNFIRKSDRMIKVAHVDFDRKNDWFRFSDEYSTWYLVASGAEISVKGHYPCTSDSSEVVTSDGL